MVTGASRPDRSTAPNAVSRECVGPRILVVDDYADVAQSTGALLECLGCIAAVAYDGAAAISLVESFLPDVVILDIEMPTLNGLEVARWVRAQPSDHHPPMLVAVTGQTGRAARQQAMDAGFDEFVSKPMDSAWLQDRVEQWRALIPGGSSTGC